MWISKEEGGCRMWIKKFLNVNIINFENVAKPEGGGRTMCIRLFCLILALFNAFLAILIHISVVLLAQNFTTLWRICHFC